MTLNPWFTPQNAVKARDDIALIYKNRTRDYWAYLGKTHAEPHMAAEDVQGLSQVIEYADVVMWSNETWSLVNSGSDDYNDREFPEEIAPSHVIQFWVIENTFMSTPPESNPFLTEAHKSANMLGILVIVTDPSTGTERHCGSYMIFEDDDGPIFYGLGRTVIGQKINNTTIFTAIAAGLDFMSLPIVSTDHAPVSRQMRREYERKHKRKYPEVRVVTLRKKAHQPTQSTQHRDVDWQCRWFVSSHRRHLASGKTSWVPGYIKGPEDKPIRVPAMSIFKVVR